jgi:hypothetical protein
MRHAKEKRATQKANERRLGFKYKNDIVVARIKNVDVTVFKPMYPIPKQK